MTEWVCGVCNNEPCTCEDISEAGRKAQEDMGGTTTASVVGAGDNPTGTVVIDKRRRKDKMPRVLKRFRKYLDSDA